MNIYFEIMARRKACLFRGDEEQAAFLLMVAEKLVEDGDVSDEEMVAAAYI